MPGTTRDATNFDKPYEDGNPSSPLSFTSQDLRGAEGAHSSPNGSISSYSRTNSFDSLDDSNSSIGSNSGGGHSRQISNDSSTGASEYIPTRSIKQAAKAQHNPLQFVKVAESPLYKKAKEQIKKYEEVKKLKSLVKQDEEDWQHNLDDWKNKRRVNQKAFDHSPDEFQRFEEEMKQKPRRKSKTFSEMLVDRAKRGRNYGYLSDDLDENGDKNSWNDFDSPKLDLSLDSSSTDCVFQDEESSDTSSVDRNHIENTDNKGKQSLSGINGNAEKHNGDPPANGHENSLNGTASEEYTFDKAIQNYVQYAESQKKGMAREKKSINGDHSHSVRNTLDEVDEAQTDILPEENSDAADKVNCSFAGERTGGTEMKIIVKLKPGPERDFGFMTRGQGRGLVFVDAVTWRGSAELAGLKVDDEILSINGEGVSNRSHSAIVFAIKQAVYTGHLELGIYRYDNANQILKQGLQNSVKKPSRVEEKKAVFSRDSSSEKEQSPEKRVFRREQSPQVDVIKRRSLFESPPKDLEVQQQQRRSLDTGSSMKNKISSFESLENIDKSGPKPVKPVEERNAVSKPKPPPPQAEKTNSSNPKLDFKKKLASFENLETLGKNSEPRPPSSERKIRLKERVSSFEQTDPVIRSFSCDLSDVNGRNEISLKRQNLKSPNPIEDYHECEDKIDGSEETDNNCVASGVNGPPRIIDVLSKEDSPEPSKEEPPTTPDLNAVSDISRNECKEMNTTIDPVNVALVSTPSAVETDIPLVEEIMQQTVITPSSETEAPKTNDCMINSKSDFELADSLEETAFLGSAPSSPQNIHKETSLNDLINLDDEQAENNWEKLDHLNKRKEQPDINNISTDLEVEHLDLSNLGEELIIVDDFDFDAPPRFLEPPKEKPPPPPSELEIPPELTDQNGLQLKRADSTKRIKKELRRLRSDFLGFESTNDQTSNDHTNATLAVVSELPIQDGKANDMKIGPTSKISHAKIKEPPKKQANLKESKLNENNKDRQQDGKTTSFKLNEEDDLARKEQEIIENLEREEQQKKIKPDLPQKTEDYPIEHSSIEKKHEKTDRQVTKEKKPEKTERQVTKDKKEDKIEKHVAKAKKEDKIERLATKEDKIERHVVKEDKIERLPAKEDKNERQIPQENQNTPELDRRLREREEQLRIQEELLRLEREKLRHEQEELERQREAYRKQIEQQLIYSPLSQISPPRVNSLPENPVVRGDPTFKDCSERNMPSEKLPPLTKADSKLSNASNISSSSPEELCKEEIRLIRQPGLEMQINSPVENISQNHFHSSDNQSRLPPKAEHYPQSPVKNKLSNGEKCIARRKQEPSQKKDPSSYNQHWLIQEAEMRRINEQNDRLRQNGVPTPTESVKENSQFQKRTLTSTNSSSQPQRQSQQNAVHKDLVNNNHSLQGSQKKPVLQQDQSNRSTEKKEYAALATHAPQPPPKTSNLSSVCANGESQMLSVSGKKKCSHCGEELGKGAAMIIESLHLFYHIHCFKCCVCHVQLGNGLSGADVRVRSQKLHCHNCYSNDEAGLKFSKV